MASAEERLPTGDRTSAAATPTDAELRSHVRTYFSMLEGELRGRSRRRPSLARETDDGDHRQAEQSWRAIASCLIEEGLPYHSGYRPLLSYSQRLRSAVEAYLRNHPELLQLMEADVDSAVGMVPEVEPGGPDAIASRAPEPGDIPEITTDTGAPTLSGADFLAQEQRNRSLATAGELFVIRYEMRRLREAGAGVYADAIEHVAAEQGGGGGCDIHSYDANGRDRYIKVKTTRFRRETPFFVTANEIAMAAMHREHFWLYRVFDFRDAPRLYTVNGPLNERFRLQPTAYRAVPR